MSTRTNHNKARTSAKAVAGALLGGIASAIAVAAGLLALFVLPSAANFLPKLRLAPRVAIH